MPRATETALILAINIQLGLVLFAVIVLFLVFWFAGLFSISFIISDARVETREADCISVVFLLMLRSTHSSWFTTIFLSHIGRS